MIALSACNGGSGSADGLKTSPDIISPAEPSPVFDIDDIISEHNSNMRSNYITYDLCEWIGENYDITASGMGEVYFRLEEMSHNGVADTNAFIEFGNYGVTEYFFGGYGPVDNTLLTFIDSPATGRCRIRTNANTLDDLVNVWWEDNGGDKTLFRGVIE